MEKPMIEVQNLKKKYRIGRIGAGTLTGDLQSLWAKIRGKEDPNSLLEQEQRLVGKSFMALGGISFSVAAGEAVGVLGVNGAGKSTLLKILSRITVPSEGRAVLRGRTVSMLEVGTGFNQEMTGRENIYLNGAILGMSTVEIDQQMDAIIEFSECADFIDTPVKRYSSGMYVKLAFSVAAHLNSEIMIMDEILAVGDVQFQQKCIERMRQAAQTEGRTILYVSHNMATIRQLCSRCIVLKEGRLVFDGGVEEAIDIYADVYHRHSVEKDLSREHLPQTAKAYMQRLAFENTSQAYFQTGDVPRIRLQWQALQSFEHATLLVTLKNSSLLAVGTAESHPVLAGKEGGHYTTRFVLDTTPLPEGQFYLDISIGRWESEQRLVYDEYQNAISFEVQKYYNTESKHKWQAGWGDVVFPALETETLPVPPAGV